MIASMIFALGIIAFFFFSINSENETSDNLDTLKYEAELIADSLLSEGSPPSWTNTGVIRIGLLSENKINKTKLEMFDTMASSDYARTKSLFGVKDNYYISFSENMTLNNNSVDFIGQMPLEPQNLLKVTRLSSYGNKPVVFYVHAWN